MLNKKAFIGSILGTAVGDSVGLPYEGMSAKRVAKYLSTPAKHRFIFGRGMLSDDTEHTCFVAKALASSGDNPDLFEKKLAWSLRWWFIGLPAGIGMATARSIIKLWLGFPVKYSAVFSAGNGPAMRSALIGLYYADDIEQLKTFVQRSTYITHSDPKAYFGALTVALAARYSALTAEINADEFIQQLFVVLGDEISSEYQQLMLLTLNSVKAGDNLKEFASTIACKKGVSGYMYHTIPCVIHTWLRHPQNFKPGLQEIIAAGGDTDTTGAIYGAIAGAQSGEEGIPEQWINGIIEYPRSVSYLRKLGSHLAASLAGDLNLKTPMIFPPLIILRNLVFLVIVLLHGFRRLLPPY